MMANLYTIGYGMAGVAVFFGLVWLGIQIRRFIVTGR